MHERKKYTNMMSRLLFSKFSFLLWIVLPITIVGCFSREEREIRHLIGRKIDFNGPLLYLDSARQCNYMPNEFPIKILTTIDYNDCYDCSFKPLIYMQQIIQKDKDLYNDVNVLAVANLLNIEKAKEELKRWNLKTVIVVDSTNYYINKNKLDNILHRNRTFILDRNDYIVFVGNPIIRKQLRPQFINVLKSLQANDGVLKDHKDPKK